MVEKSNIRSITEEELVEFLLRNGEQKFRAKQIWQWIWSKGVTSFDQMQNLSMSLRESLDANFYFDFLTEHHIQTATDGTTKIAWNLTDGNLVESVLIPGKERFTVCVSSQVGCKLGCKFCATASLGFKRNLTTGEIFEQVVHAREEAEKRGGTLSNIVFMGMGEPLLNYDQVRKAIRKITSPEGLGMSPSRITLSTAGIADQIRKMADDGIKVNLAVSLHTANNSLRDTLMPVNKISSLKELGESISYYFQKTGIRPTLEYLLLGGVNDRQEDAQALALYCRQFPVKINIIEYNPSESIPFLRSNDAARDSFVQFLENKNMIVNIRKSKGQDIDAACGQLANKLKKQ